jgi:RNA polymerase sigma-70 factor, ECF subfamily
MNPNSRSVEMGHDNSPATDDKLIEFVQEAERQRSYLKWIAARMITDAEDVEDIVQQALLKAFVSLQRFRGDAKMRTWLHTIVLNTAREHLRNRKRRIPLQTDARCQNDDEDAFRDIPHPGLGPEGAFAEHEADAILHAEINVLSPFCKHAIEMCVIQEIPYREAAGALKTNPATLKSRVHHAKEHLRRAMNMRNLVPRDLLPAHSWTESRHPPKFRQGSSQ